MHLTIRKFAYLKTPRFSVTLHNDQGGSCSSGDQSSLRSAVSHIWFSYRNIVLENPTIPVKIETWTDFDDSDNPIFTTEETSFPALMFRTKVSR